MPTGELIKSIALSSDANLIQCDGRTVGDSSSSATINGSDYHDVFIALWNAPSTFGLTVSGGRGASAELDWAAHKTITAPTLDDSEGPYYVMAWSEYPLIISLQGSITTLNAAVTSLQNPTVANPTRSLNSAFQISSSKAAFVSYSVDVATALTLTTGQQGTVYLRYADDSGHTTNVKEVCRYVNGNTGTLAIGANITQTGTGTLSGFVPAGKYAKIVTENNTGTPSFAMRNAQEVTYG